MSLWRLWRVAGFHRSTLDAGCWTLGARLRRSALDARRSTLDAGGSKLGAPEEDRVLRAWGRTESRGCWPVEVWASLGCACDDDEAGATCCGCDRFVGADRNGARADAD